MKLRAFAAVGAVIVGLTVFTAGTQAIARDDLNESFTDVVQTFAAGRYIVKVRGNSSPDSVLNDHLNVRGKARKFRSAIRGFVAELTADEVSDLANDSRVLSIEVDPIISVRTPQNRSTLVGSGSNVWGIDRIDQIDLPLNQGFTALTDGSGAYVYVVDTPIRTSHSQFLNRVLSGYSAPGIAFETGCDGHGTHVAGTTLGSTVGVAPGARLIPVAVLDCDGYGSTSDVIGGLEWILDDVQTNGRRPAVVNLSLGGDAFPDLDNAVNDLISAGISVVVAAGNDGEDACGVSPARTPNALTVAASDEFDDEAVFLFGSTNYGTCIDIFAPGKDILSAWSIGDESGAFLDGTSMAAPHVAGVVALMLESNPCATPAQITDSLLTNGVTNKISMISGRSPQSVNRLLQVGSISGTPCAPRSVFASPGDSQSIISWTLPTGPGGSTDFTYTVSTMPTSSGCVTTELTCTITGLSNGQTYIVSVTATNEFGTSATASTTTVVPEGAPIRPTISGVDIGNTSATVSWGSVPSTSTVTYTATAQPGGQSCTTTQLSCAIPGLTNGATYTFTVVAVNASGASSPSSGAITALYSAPPTPVVNRIRTKSKQATLTWTALSVPYTPSYKVRIVGTNKTCTTTATSCSISKLVNGKRYRLTVTATNVVGDGPPSVRTPYVVPGINVLRFTIPRKKKVSLSKFITTLSAGRKSYSITKGQCKISSGYLVAPTRSGTCTLRLSVSASGAYPSMYNTVNIKVT